MLRINLFGGPGAGKSTIAALLFAELKNQCKQVELVREVVKSWAYEGRRPDEWDQVYTFGQQLYEEHRLQRAGVKVIVSDSPLLLQCFYSGCNTAELATMARRYEAANPSFNILVVRTKPYSELGRFQKETEAVALDNAIEEYMINQQIPHLKLQGLGLMAEVCNRRVWEYENGVT